MQIPSRKPWWNRPSALSEALQSEVWGVRARSALGGPAVPARPHGRAGVALSAFLKGVRWGRPAILASPHGVAGVALFTLLKGAKGLANHLFQAQWRGKCNIFGTTSTPKTQGGLGGHITRGLLLVLYRRTVR